MHLRGVSHIVFAFVLALAVSGCAGAARSPAEVDEASTATETATILDSQSPGNPAQLTTADIQRLFYDFAAYRALVLADEETTPLFPSLVRQNVDFRSYARDERRDFPLYEGQGWASGIQAEPGPQMDAKVTEALAAFDRIAGRTGEEAAIDKALHAWDPIEHGGATRDDELLDFVLPDFGLLFLMIEPPYPSGAQDADVPDWEWRVVDLSIEGTDTARLVYEASANHTEWSFADSSVRYEIVLRMSYDPSQARWRIAGWSNRKEFIRRFEENLLVPDDGTWPHDQPFWSLL